MTAAGAPNSVQIRHVIVHDLVKAKSGAATLDLSTSELAITPVVQRVVEILASEYRRRASKSHGRFTIETTNVPVPDLVRKYAIDSSINFVTLTCDMAQSLRDRAQHQPAATGGHVLFAHVTEDSIGDAFLVAIVTDEVGAAITKAKEMEESLYLNMKGFRYAGRIDLSGYKGGADRYVSFLRGTGKDVSDYFKIFLGCDTTIVARAETQKLSDALREFAVSNAMDDTKRTAFLKEANDYLVGLSQSGELFEVEPFANKLWPTAPEKLVTVLEDPGIKLSAGFVPHKGALRDLVKFAGAKAGLWKVEFERKAILSGDVVFNHQDDTLTFKNLPAELVAQLKDETSDE